MVRPQPAPQRLRRRSPRRDGRDARYLDAAPRTAVTHDEHRHLGRAVGQRGAERGATARLRLGVDTEQQPWHVGACCSSSHNPTVSDRGSDVSPASEPTSKARRTAPGCPGPADRTVRPEVPHRQRRSARARQRPAPAAAAAAARIWSLAAAPDATPGTSSGGCGRDGSGNQHSRNLSMRCVRLFRSAKSPCLPRSSERDEKETSNEVDD